MKVIEAPVKLDQRMLEIESVVPGYPTLGDVPLTQTSYGARGAASRPTAKGNALTL